MKKQSTAAQIPCTELKGVGPKMAEQLEKCSIRSVQDILFHLPFRYQDRTRVTPMAGLHEGDYAVVDGVIESSFVSQGKRRIFTCRLRDGSGFIDLKFFHFYPAQQQQLCEGAKLRCFGEIKGFRHNLEMIHPEYQRVFEDTPIPVDETLTPIYPTTAGLQQKSLRNLTDQALLYLEQNDILNEHLPDDLRQEHSFPNLADAIRYVHRPPPDAVVSLLEEGVHPTQQRLAYEELLAHQLSVRKLRYAIQQYQAPEMDAGAELQDKFLTSLPFKLTGAQDRVINEIKHDLTRSQAMLRLVQGDVGSGKTVVAAMACLQCVAAGYQAVLMAPTELLAEQHYTNFTQWFEPLGIELAWLAGKLGAKQKRSMLESIALGNARVIVGTHALFQKDVVFKDLGLCIIDEQHRFGVHQRMALREKGEQGDVMPHQLIMTATPIPRTLSMTAYADLDVSVIDELPPGRTPVQTIAVSNSRREDIIEHIRTACAEQRQAYWVCTLIEESEVLQCQAAEDAAVTLADALPELTIGLVHGRLKSAEKETIMQCFKAGDIDLLVATTVIEVGVDVPNASLMVIENPERLGLAQLHQLRGRVGRGTAESYCTLLYQTPLSEHARERIKVMRETNDGFEIARKDLELRGPGELLGTRQTGMLRLKIADLMRDKDLIPLVQQSAIHIQETYPERVEPLIKRWLADGEQYGTV